jgi:hypothetical protein
MARRIITLAASALALGTFGIAPLAAQAGAPASVNSAVTVQTEVNETLSVTDSGTVDLGSFTPDASTKPTAASLTLTINTNVPAYQVKFSDGNTGFKMSSSGSASTLAYKITPDNTTLDTTSSYVEDTYGSSIANTLLEMTPKFDFALVTAPAASTPTGEYSDSITYTVTATS